MYLIPTVVMAPNDVCYYSSLSGRYCNQQTHCGVEESCTPVRGYMLAILQGLRQIEELHGLQCLHHCDVLITDSAIHKQFDDGISKGSVSADEPYADFWNRLLAKRTNFALRFVSSPAESEHLKTIWAWSAVPPLRAELPWIELNPEVL